MGRLGSAPDNAVIESWHSTLEFELRRIEHFATGGGCPRAGGRGLDRGLQPPPPALLALGRVSPVDYERSLAGKGRRVTNRL